MAYDAVGNVTSVTQGISPNGNQSYQHLVVTNYVYDYLNRQTLVMEAPYVSALRRVTTIGYNALDKVVRIEKRSSELINNALSLVTAVGSLAADFYLDFPRSAGATYRNRVDVFEYDALGRQTKTTADVGGIGQTTTTTYDSVGNVTLVQYANNTRTKYLYDALNRRTKTIEAFGRTDQRTTETGYDSNDNVTVTIDGNQIRTEYRYDDLNRQTSVIEAVGVRGQRTTEKDYDAANNVIRTRSPWGMSGYDIDLDGVANANAAKVTTCFIYDARNRLRIQADNVNGPGLVRRTYTNYDAAGNVTSTVDARASALDTTTIR